MHKKIPLQPTLVKKRENTFSSIALSPSTDLRQFNYFIILRQILQTPLFYIYFLAIYWLRAKPPKYPTDILSTIHNFPNRIRFESSPSLMFSEPEERRAAMEMEGNAFYGPSTPAINISSIKKSRTSEARPKGIYRNSKGAIISQDEFFSCANEENEFDPRDVVIDQTESTMVDYSTAIDSIVMESAQIFVTGIQSRLTAEDTYSDINSILSVLHLQFLGEEFFLALRNRSQSELKHGGNINSPMVITLRRPYFFRLHPDFDAGEKKICQTIQGGLHPSAIAGRDPLSLHYTFTALHPSINLLAASPCCVLLNVSWAEDLLAQQVLVANHFFTNIVHARNNSLMISAVPVAFHGDLKPGSHGRGRVNTMAIIVYLGKSTIVEPAQEVLTSTLDVIWSDLGFATMTDAYSPNSIILTISHWPFLTVRSPEHIGYFGVVPLHAIWHHAYPGIKFELPYDSNPVAILVALSGIPGFPARDFMFYAFQQITKSVGKDKRSIRSHAILWILLKKSSMVDNPFWFRTDLRIDDKDVVFEKVYNGELGPGIKTSLSRSTSNIKEYKDRKISLNYVDASVFNHRKGARYLSVSPDGFLVKLAARVAETGNSTQHSTPTVINSRPRAAETSTLVAAVQPAASTLSFNSPENLIASLFGRLDSLANRFEQVEVSQRRMEAKIIEDKLEVTRLFMQVRQDLAPPSSNELATEAATKVAAAALIQIIPSGRQDNRSKRGRVDSERTAAVDALLVGVFPADSPPAYLADIHKALMQDNPVEAIIQALIFFEDYLRLETAVQSGALTAMNPGMIKPTLQLLLSISDTGIWPPLPIAQLQFQMLQNCCEVGTSEIPGCHSQGLFLKPAFLQDFSAVTSLYYPGRIQPSTTDELMAYAVSLPNFWFDPDQNYTQRDSSRLIVGDRGQWLPMANFNFHHLRMNHFVISNDGDGSIGVNVGASQLTERSREINLVYDVNREHLFINQLLIHLIASNMMRISTACQLDNQMPDAVFLELLARQLMFLSPLAPTRWQDIQVHIPSNVQCEHKDISFITQTCRGQRVTASSWLQPLVDSCGPEFMQCDVTWPLSAQALLNIPAVFSDVRIEFKQLSLADPAWEIQWPDLSPSQTSLLSDSDYVPTP